MDLHLTGATATPEEKAAVDSKLGSPESGWTGGERDVAADGRVAFGGAHKSDNQRHLLLPVLHAIHNRIGWISEGAINYTSLRMDLPPAEVYGVASFYGMFSLKPRPATVAHVCDDIACMTRGSEELCDELENRLGPEGLPCVGGRAVWLRSNCLGLCERAPAVLVARAGKAARERVLAPATPERVQSLINDAANEVLPAAPDVLNPQLSVPQEGSRKLALLRRVGKINAVEIDGYQRLGGYEALRKALDLGPEGVLREVSASRLLGRGGAAFPAAKKWEALYQQREILKANPERKHYVICNADESEPGTFKDRLVMEGDPFAVLEGMTIAAMVTGAEVGYIYLRGEYPLAAERIAHAIDAARREGFLGQDVLGRGLRFDIELRRGAGAYICGEETALFNSIEGFRGEPRNKPPFPTQAGLFRQPTVVNNVETLVNVPDHHQSGRSRLRQRGH